MVRGMAAACMTPLSPGGGHVNAQAGQLNGRVTSGLPSLGPACVMETVMEVQVGDVFRDTQYDRGTRSGLDLTRRTIRIIEVRQGDVLAQAVTDYRGNPAARAPRRRISMRTLGAQYDRVGA